MVCEAFPSLRGNRRLVRISSEASFPSGLRISFFLVFSFYFLRGGFPLEFFAPGSVSCGPFAGKVDEGLLSGAVPLSHRGLQFLGPTPVDLTELAVGISLWIRFSVLFPQQVQGDSNTLQLLVDPRNPRSRSRNRCSRWIGISVQDGPEYAIPQKPETRNPCKQGLIRLSGGSPQLTLKSENGFCFFSVGCEQ